MTAQSIKNMVVIDKNTLTRTLILFVVLKTVLVILFSIFLAAIYIAYKKSKEDKEK